MKIAVVIWEDRHSDTTVHPFVDKEEAIEWAKTQVQMNDRHGDAKEIAITPSMAKEGWLYCGQYSCEGDGLTVVEVELRGAMEP